MADDILKDLAIFGFLCGLFVVWHNSFKILMISSNSMAPAIQKHDMVVVQKMPSYQINDVVSYIYKNPVTGKTNYITHRIVGKSEESFLTKGDANVSPDSSLLTQTAVTGKVIYVSNIFREFLQLSLDMPSRLL